MQIQCCLTGDVDNVFDLYEDARRLQTARNMVVWPFFDKQFLKEEIANGRQWKIIRNSDIACNWAITFTDKDIWEEKERGDAIYIHRIVTNPAYRGNNFVKTMVEWAKAYARQHNRKYVRLDTLGNNTRLIEHYTKCGFTFLGIVRLANTQNLPLHYQKEPDCCLFEVEV